MFENDASALLRVSHLKPFILGMDEVGLSWEQLFRAARLPVLVVHEPQGFVAERLTWKLCGLAARHAGAGDFGLRAARAHPVWNTEPAVVATLAQMPSVLSSLRELRHASRRVSTGPGYRVLTTGDGVLLCHDTWQGVEGAEQVELYTLLMLTQIVQILVGKHWQPSEIHVGQANRHILAATPEFNSCRMIRNENFTAVKIASADLVRAPRRVESPRTGLNSSVSPPDDVLESLRAALRPYLTEARPEVSLAAEICGMSQRTFQRRLAQFGLSYRQLIDQVCFEEARVRLSAAGSTITDVAFDLGFRNVPSFTRAFHRWTGMSPRKYRYHAHERTEFA